MQPRALLSVHDKTGLVELGEALDSLGYELIASGGTARALATAGLPVRQVDEVTGFPEILGGRVKTLHPAIHGAILARRTPEQLSEIKTLGFVPIDIVVCNLYPFAATVRRPGVTEAQAVEEIDIGGVTLLRAAAKNYASVAVVCDPADYGSMIELLRTGSLHEEERRRLALAAFNHTADYDAAIAAWFADSVSPGEVLPQQYRIVAERAQSLRYGENPHQRAALYRWRDVDPTFRQLQGKELSYNNLLDLDAAWAIPGEFSDPTIAIIKHTNPCGLASATTLVEAYRLALECDPVSAFGSIVATNRVVTWELVSAIGGLFLEALVAPEFTTEALAWLSRHKPNCRVIVGTRNAVREVSIRTVAGGFVAQTEDDRGVEEANWRIVTRRAPTEEEMLGLRFAWLGAKHVKSNAIVLARGSVTVGVGAGQMNRVEAVHLAIRRAGERARGSVMGSDAFFPFADGVEAAAGAGVTACVQPGGSLRDPETIAAADRLGMAMIFTGERHFRH